MKVALSGASGLVGSLLRPLLEARGHQVLRLVRRQARAADECSWEPETGRLDQERMDGVEVVIHLAGENIAARRWSEEQKARIRDSRVAPTRRLARSLAALPIPPHTFLCASAIGFYGDRPGQRLTERSPAGDGFLPEVCVAWEGAARTMEGSGARVCTLRLGVVLSPDGGALERMLLPFRLGGGGRLGSGQQQMSWISLDDAAAAIHHVLTTPELRGPVNLVAPEPCSNAEFTRTLARVLRRPALLPVPAWAAKLAFGELAEALLLASTAVVPEALLAHGFRFQHPHLEGALRHLLGATPAVPDRAAQDIPGGPACTPTPPVWSRRSCSPAPRTRCSSSSPMRATLRRSRPPG